VELFLEFEECSQELAFEEHSQKLLLAFEGCGKELISGI
jgi:hypothetical protein